jgi:hypothetical protein
MQMKFFEKFFNVAHRKTKRALYAEIESYKILLEVVKEENGDYAKLLNSAQTEARNASYERDVFKARYLLAMELMRQADVDKTPSTAALKAAYDNLLPEMDPYGLYKLKAAEALLGPFNETMFIYETGSFEDETFGAHLQYKALLVQYADKLGQPYRDRWEVVQCAGGYEKCTDWTIDETTPEFVRFEADLYRLIFENWGCKELLTKKSCP